MLVATGGERPAFLSLSPEISTHVMNLCQVFLCVGQDPAMGPEALLNSEQRILLQSLNESERTA